MITHVYVFMHASVLYEYTTQLNDFKYSYLRLIILFSNNYHLFTHVFLFNINNFKQNYLIRRWGYTTLGQNEPRSNDNE